LLPEHWSQPIPNVDVWHRRGSADGPRVLLTAGIHGDEYEGPAALLELLAFFHSAPLHGSLTVIPVANPMAWSAATRTSPDDGLNLARVFPGNAQGSATEQLAAAIWRIADQQDYVIDLHSGGSDYLFMPLAGYYAGNDASLEAACHFGLSVLWQLPETNGVLSCEMHRRGRTAVGCEYLGAGQLSRPGMQAYMRGVRSCLALWGALPGESPLPIAGDRYAGDWMLAEATGAFFAHVSLGDHVEPGELLATIRDRRGHILQSFTAPAAGRILALRAKGYIRAADWGVLVATHA